MLCPFNSSIGKGNVYANVAKTYKQRFAYTRRLHPKGMFLVMFAVNESVGKIGILKGIAAKLFKVGKRVTKFWQK